MVGIMCNLGHSARANLHQIPPAVLFIVLPSPFSVKVVPRLVKCFLCVPTIVTNDTALANSDSQ